jgi:class 3 adenylate cyclase
MREEFGYQQSDQQHWLNHFGLRPLTVVIVSCFWIMAFLVLFYFGVDQYLNTKVADPINFRVRDALGRAPTMNERLKVFAIDDQTFAKIGTPMPSIAIWSEVLDSIAQKKPKIIIVDALFSASGDGISPKTREWMASVKKTGVPIVTGSFVHETPLEFKHPLDLSSDLYQLQRYVGPNPKKTIEDWRFENLPSWVLRDKWQAYGPSPNVSSFFDRVGHFQLFTENQIEPFLLLGRDTILPHVSMYIPDSLSFKNKQLVINGRELALGRHGEMPVKFMAPGSRNIQSMLPIIEDALEGNLSPYVDEGDVVLILPLYFTGNVDLRPSPYGWMPGGHYLVDMFNSVLNDDYLQPVLVGEVLTTLSVIAAVAVAYHVSASISWILWPIVAFAFFVVSQILFTYFNLVVPYVLPLLAGTLAGANIYALRVRGIERKTQVLRSALDGAVSPQQLDALIRRPDEISLEPRERVVTLMFIDIVGFSLSSESMAPKEAFNNLKSILNRISDIVHAEGGIIDKTLGDGLLCYFGYRFDSDQIDANHSESALRCAIKIQEQMFEENLLAARSSAPIYPLRIGVNTASCYLGDLGSGKRIEFTVVGNGVNFAKRLESACSVFCVMIGATTYELVRGLPWPEGMFTQKVIKIKHHTDLRDAIEVDPMRLRSDEVREVLTEYHRQTSFHRGAERIQVKEAGSILAVSAAGDGFVLDFTSHGASILFQLPRARGDVFEFKLESRIPGLQDLLSKHDINDIEAEVRWVHAAVDGTVHGVVFRNIRVDQYEIFIRILSEFAFSGLNKNFGGVGGSNSEAS